VTLIVEDGTGVEDATSYISIAFADGYFTTRSIAAWTGSDAVKEAAIIRAMDYVETRWTFLGLPLFTDDPVQALKWPRQGIYENGLRVEGIPTNLKRAVAEYALRALSITLLPDPAWDGTSLPVKSTRQKLGPIEKETVFQDGATPQLLKPYPAADRLLAAYVLQPGRAVRA